MATIMVIDDEPSIRGLLREVLERSGHKVVEAKDGREALDLYQKHKADLLIMDLLMPEVDGLEATLQLTREYMDTKIIAMTGAQGDRNFLDIPKRPPDLRKTLRLEGNAERRGSGTGSEVIRTPLRAPALPPEAVHEGKSAGNPTAASARIERCSGQPQPNTRVSNPHSRMASLVCLEHADRARGYPPAA